MNPVFLFGWLLGLATAAAVVVGVWVALAVYALATGRGRYILRLPPADAQPNNRSVLARVPPQGGSGTAPPRNRRTMWGN